MGKSKTAGAAVAPAAEEIALPLWMDIQITLIGLLQRSFRQIPILNLLDRPLRYASVIGSGIPAFAQSILVVWTLDCAGGILVGRILVFSIFCVGFVKSCVLGLRPFKCSSTRLEHLDPNNEVSGGFPSGHTSSFASLLLGYMRGVVVLKTVTDAVYGPALRAIGVCLLALVALSRVYTAAHFFHDLAGGLAISFALDYMFEQMELLDRHNTSITKCNMLLVGLIAVALGRLSLRVGADGRVKTALVFEIIFSSAAAMGLLLVQSYLAHQGHTGVEGPVVERWTRTSNPTTGAIRTVCGGIGVFALSQIASKASGVTKHREYATWTEIFVYHVFFSASVFWGYVAIMELTAH